MDLREIGTIGILMGGYSSERDISLKSGNAILSALQEEGCQCVGVDITDSQDDLIKQMIEKANMDVAFIALHGVLGEDGKIQTLLDELDIPYTGSSAQASAQAFDKVVTQSILKEHDLDVPAFTVFSKGEVRSVNLDLFPVVVKPACEGSSIGITIVETEKDFEKALELAFEYGDEVLVDEYIKGKELTVGILDHEALPVIEIKSKGTFFDFKAKYSKGETDYIVPAKLDEKITLSIQKKALAAYNLLGCQSMARVDFMLDASGNSYILEVNTIPGFTETSLLPMAAKKVGINFNQLCLKLTELAYGQKKEKIK